MRLCLSTLSQHLCQNPLPCRTHGTHTQVATRPELQWLIEPVMSGVLVTLIKENRRIGETRWCAHEDGPGGLNRVKDYLLQEASVPA